jgi:Tfp pilus assembly protein PilO
MTPRLRIAVAIAASLGVIASLWIGVIAPKREQAADLRARIAQAEQTRDDATARAIKAEQAQATYARDYGTVARLGKAVPPSTDVPSLVYQLATAARGAKIDFRAVNVLDSAPVAPAPAGPAEATAGGGIESTPISFKFEGDFFGLQKLLARIDRFSRVKGTQIAVNGRLLTIDGLTVNPSRRGLPRVQGLVTARAYVAEIPDALPGAGTNAATTPTGSPTATPASQVTP